jgi:FkbM family methyltransferase
MELAAVLKAICPVAREPVLAEGASWLVDPASNFGDRLLREGTYEPGLLSAIRAVLRPGDTFIDVGANEGWFSILAARQVGPQGRVIAVEPQARLTPVIEAHIRRNGLGNVTLLSSAFGATASVAELALTPSTNSGATSLLRTRRQRWARRQSVAVHRLDTVAAMYGLTTIRCVKIDVEGFERDVLDGAGAWLDSGRIDYLLLETHPEALAARGDSREAIERWLRALGYVSEWWDGVYLWRWHERPCPPKPDDRPVVGVTRRGA